MRKSLFGVMVAEGKEPTVMGLDAQKHMSGVAQKAESSHLHESTKTEKVNSVVKL